MSEVAAVVPVTKEQIANLAALDAWLHVGPKYVRNAAIGAVAGVAVAMVIAKKKKNASVTVKAAALGAGATLVGGFLVFQLGKWASQKEHEHLHVLAPHAAPPAQPVVTKGAFAGAPRTLYPTTDAHEVYR